jgi:hypothetical protein
MASWGNPTPSKNVLNPSRVERKVMCAGYQNCLDETIKRKWDGFSCRSCKAFRPLQFEPSEWLADSVACIALLYVAEFENCFKQKPRGGIVAKLQQSAREDQWIR